MSGKIAILIDAELHNELVLRTRSAKDVTGYIEHAIESYLDGTEGDDGLWSPEYIEELQNREVDDWLIKYGDPQKGHHWQMLFLPNGTRLKMAYKGRDSFAEIRHGKLMDGEVERSPSEWASVVASHTNRNAWRDIWIQRPGDAVWHLADALRRKEREGK